MGCLEVWWGAEVRRCFSRSGTIRSMFDNHLQSHTSTSPPPSHSMLEITTYHWLHMSLAIAYPVEQDIATRYHICPKACGNPKTRYFKQQYTNGDNYICPMLVANFSPGALEPIITSDLNFVNIWLRKLRQNIRLPRTQWSFPVSEVGKKASNFLKLVMIQ